MGDEGNAVVLDFIYILYLPKENIKLKIESRPLVDDRVAIPKKFPKAFKKVWFSRPRTYEYYGEICYIRLSYTDDSTSGVVRFHGKVELTKESRGIYRLRTYKYGGAIAASDLVMWKVIKKSWRNTY